MIISASRRTDVPALYSDWFFNRINEGFLMVRNPMNIHQVSKINLSPEIVDGIIFWTKNPIPMIKRLNELDEYMYYFQFTITPYGKDIEPNLPEKNETIISSFKELSHIIGADRVIWRYDPILINNKYSFDYHVHAFTKISEELHDYTRKVTISFIDEGYRGVKSNLNDLLLHEFPSTTKIELGSKFAEIAHSYGLEIDTCAEEIELKKFGIEHARCIDDRLLAKLLDCQLDISKDKTQRLECGCVTSVDIGMYNTCKNECRYCYANYSVKTVDSNYAKHNPLSPLISGEISESDKISIRDVKSCRNAQMRIFA